MARERRRFEIVDNRNEEYTASGGRSYLKLPSGLGFYKAKPGVFRADFVPFECTDAHTKFARGQGKAGQYSRPGALYWERTFYLHEDLGPDRQKHACLLANWDKPCPRCEQAARLRQDPATKEAGWQMRAKEWQLFLLQLRNDRTGAIEGPLQLWEVKYFNFGKQLDEFKSGADPEDYAAYNRFYDPDDGYTVKVNGVETPSGEGRRPYNKFSVLEFKARREPLPDELLDHGYDLDAMIRETPYEAMLRIIGGTEEDAQISPGEEQYQSPGGPRLDGPESEPQWARDARARVNGEGRPARAAASPPPARGGYESAPTTGHLERPARPARVAPPPAPEPEPEPLPAEDPDSYALGGEGVDDAPPDGFLDPAAQPDFVVGDRVKFSHKGRLTYGVVAAMDANGIFHVPVAGQERPKYLEADEMALVEDDAEWKRETAVKAAPPPAAKAAPPRRPAPAPAAAPPPPAAEPSADPQWDAPAAPAKPPRPTRPKG